MKYLEELAQSHEPLSVKEAAKIYGCSAHTFYKKIRRGEIPGVFREPGKRRSRIKIWPGKYAPWLLDQMATGTRPAAVTATHTKHGTQRSSTGAGGDHEKATETSAVVKRIAKGVGSE